MKYIIITGVVLSTVVGGALFIKPEVQEFTAPAIVEKLVEKEVIKGELETRIQEALSASSTEIEAEAQKAYEDRKQFIQTEIELSVTRAYRQEIEAREAELEKQTGEY